MAKPVKKATARPIVVEQSDDERWNAAGRRLHEVNADEFHRLLALTQAFVAVEERELESSELFVARLAQIANRGDAEAN